MARELTYTDWGSRFQAAGWRPPNLHQLAEQLIGVDTRETVLGIMGTGDGLGSLLEFRKRWLVDEYNVDVKTIAGFTTSLFESWKPGDSEVISPNQRIQGGLVVTTKRFVVVGPYQTEIIFEQLEEAMGTSWAKEGVSARSDSRYRPKGDAVGGMLILQKGRLFYGMSIVCNEIGRFHLTRSNIFDLWRDVMDALRRKT